MSDEPKPESYAEEFAAWESACGLDGMCEHPGCNANVTHDLTVWVTPSHMRVDYFCAEHAPTDATPIDEFDDGQPFVP